MSGGVAYVLDAGGGFGRMCNMAMVDLERLGAGAPSLPGGDEAGRPRQRAPGVHDNGMGDLLRHDAERLRILVERHHLRTGSARARELLENWDEALGQFVKVMPKDYRRALLDMEAERNAAKTVAAE
jgi:glutamate synthase (NADPH/NADH) large chain